MHIIDIIVFLLFTGGVVAFGCSFFKKKGTSEYGAQNETYIED